MRLETRPPNVEGKGAVHQRQLVINSLRMRPDRIIVGEVRGEEALDMLQAMNTGHDGSLTTIHANSARDALGRLETMIAMSALNLPELATRRQIASALDVVVQIRSFMTMLLCTMRLKKRTMFWSRSRERSPGCPNSPSGVPILKN